MKVSWQRWPYFIALGSGGVSAGAGLVVIALDLGNRQYHAAALEALWLPVIAAITWGVVMLDRYSARRMVQLEKTITSLDLDAQMKRQAMEQMRTADSVTLHAMAGAARGRNGN